MGFLYTIKNILKQNLDVYYSYKNRNKINPKIGLTPTEIAKLNNSSGEGSATFLGNKFYFSNPISFLHSVFEIFNEDIYKFKTENETPYIIDCGSSYGLSIIYFNRLFPKAEIIGFEPDNKIFNILNKNINTYCSNSNIILKNSAVWTEDTSLEFFVENGLAGSLLTDFSNNNNKIAVKAENLNNYLNKKIDFLKMDIEGAENKVFFKIKDKLYLVENLFLEYHGIIGEEQNLHEILSIISENGFQYYIRLACDTVKYPFMKEQHNAYNQQLNIFCYRN